MEQNALAINGGKPVREEKLPYGHQDIHEADINTVIEVLRSPWLTTGPQVTAFEESIAEFVGAKYGVSFSSGTAALHGAAYAAGLEPGDQAITSPMTFCATPNCVVYMGASPVFCDVRSDTLNIDPDDALTRVNSRTKAIIPVDYGGNPADLDELSAIAEKHNLVLIEDAAHALGAKYKGRRIGSVAHMTMFSFHPVKHITTGEGGLITTDNPEYARRLKMFRTHGIDQETRQRHSADKGGWFYEMEELGFNYRLSDIACALGLSQLRRIEDNLARRREIARSYTQAFSGVRGIDTPIEGLDANSAWHLYPIRLQLNQFKVGRKQIFQALRQENIDVNVHYIPAHLHPYYAKTYGFQPGDYPKAEAAYEELISLPMFHAMSQMDIDDVVQAVTKVVNYYLVPLEDIENP